ncbi:hypothetical protein AGMMS50222_06110 [Endomicrobiia bacterium]|nr:hypothetical protein AGMMS50222_06110 [Endomicrobiia bacterium]
MKKTIGLITIILGLIISSCDKKNAVLVNRRTASSEKIEKINEAERTKAEVIKEAQRAKTKAQEEAKQEEKDETQTTKAKEEEKLAVTPLESEQVSKQEKVQDPVADPIPEPTKMKESALDPNKNLAQVLEPTTAKEKKRLAASAPILSFSFSALVEEGKEIMRLEEEKAQAKLRPEDLEKQNKLLAEYYADHPIMAKHYTSYPPTSKKKMEIVDCWLKEKEQKRERKEREKAWEEGREDERNKLLAEYYAARPLMAGYYVLYPPTPEEKQEIVDRWLKVKEQKRKTAERKEWEELEKEKIELERKIGGENREWKEEPTIVLQEKPKER